MLGITPSSAKRGMSAAAMCWACSILKRRARGPVSLSTRANSVAKATPRRERHCGIDARAQLPGFVGALENRQVRPRTHVIYRGDSTLRDVSHRGIERAVEHRGRWIGNRRIYQVLRVVLENSGRG